MIFHTTADVLSGTYPLSLVDLYDKHAKHIDKLHHVEKVNTINIS